MAGWKRPVLSAPLHRLQKTNLVTYGGFYTQDDIKELVKYAADRFVNIMPEVDVPGHSMSVCVASLYPRTVVHTWNVPREPFRAKNSRNGARWELSTWHWLEATPVSGQ